MDRPLQKDLFLRGLVRRNPVFVMILGLCPALAVTYQVNYAVVMGLTAYGVLLITSGLMVLLRDFFARNVLVPFYFFLSALVTAAAVLLLKTQIPLVVESLGIYLSLSAVIGVILGRGMSLQPERGFQQVLADAAGTGLGFVLALTSVALVREALGAGRITLFSLGPFDGVIAIPLLAQNPPRFFLMGAGGFLVLGYLTALGRAGADRLEQRFRRNSEGDL